MELIKDEDEKAQALAKYLDVDVSEVSNDKDIFEVDGDEYLVLTDEEANELWEENLENYIEECILPELPEAYRYYFDNEEWIRDAKMDGRGHSLNRYDGEEGVETINDTDYYIYRQN